MKFRKINDKTINCIITQDDMKKHGIDLDDLFDRKKNAVEFIKAIIAKAARSVNFNMKNEYTSMRLSVLPDHSVSLTISQDPFENEKIRKEADIESPAVPNRGTCLFRFSSLSEMAPCCRVLSPVRGIESSVYFDPNTEVYYLILKKGPEADEDYDSCMLSANEFGRMVTCSDRTLSYLTEHSECIVKKGALRTIAEIYS